MGKKFYSTVIVILGLFSFIGAAQADKAFVFSCKDVKTKTYRYLDHPDGQVLSDGWENELSYIVEQNHTIVFNREPSHDKPTRRTL